MTTSLDMTIREIVADDFRAAAVFQRLGIDFCCRGNRTIEEACVDHRIDAADMLRQVAEATASTAAGTPRFNSWDLATLARYIVANHHAFVRTAIPPLLIHTRKVSAIHGAAHPELPEVAELFQSVATEMTSHMAREEQVLFPYIVALEATVREGATAPPAPFSTVRSPIRVMELEHEAAGSAMARIRMLTADLAIPAEACTTYSVCLQELEAFERDLHEHVHLENNILFPKAERLDNRAR